VSSAAAGAVLVRVTNFGCCVVTSLNHVEILRRGSQAWNEWRAQNPAERPHLSRVTLSLSERQWGPMHGGPINLKSAILPDASLRFASLLDADLQAADLTRADLVHARLDRANLKNAILTDAVLDHADFADAHLGRAILTGASLSHARNLTQDQIDETIGDASTTLPAHLERPAAWVDETIGDASTTMPAHLERPAAWVEVASEPPPSPTFYRKALIAGASACVIAGIILLGVPRDEQHVETTAGAAKPQQVEQPSQASDSSTTASNALPPALNAPDQDSKKSTSESMTSPDTKQAESQNSVAILTPLESTERSAFSNENLTIGPTVRVEGVLGWSVQEEGATARVELSPVSAFASLGSSERWPSIALSTPAPPALRATPPSAETAPPLPDRKPVVVQLPPKAKEAIATYEKPASPTANELRAIPPIAETAPPFPDRKPVIVQSSTKPKMANPAYVKPAAGTANELPATPPNAETAPPPDGKPVVVQSPAKSKVAVPAHVKPHLPGARRREVVQQPLQVKPSSSTADVLAGGL